MSQLRAMQVGVRSPDACYDRIEQDIIRAYVRLALTSDQADGSRSVRLAQFGSVEVRLSEGAIEDMPPNVPPFWVEIYSYASDTIVDSCGCFEFDEDELSAAVELVIEAQQGQRLH
jgi:hypothetical protein